MGLLGDRIVTRVEIDDVPIDITDDRKEGETDEHFIDRHIAHVKTIIENWS